MTCLESPRATCALGGALSLIHSIHRAVPIIHAGPGCGTVLNGGQITSGGYQYIGYSSGFQSPSSNMLEKHVVFGGEDRLREEIGNTLKVIDADLYFVVTGCTSGLIGDDVKAVVGEFADQGKHVIFAETAGFKGDTYKGYDIAYTALIDQVTKPAKKKTPKLVNLFGIIAGQDPFWQGNVEEIVRLLEKIGVNVNLSGYDDTVKQIEDAAKAELNIVLSGSTGVAVAEHFKKKFGVPFLKYPLPVGTDTGDFLRAVAKKLAIDKEKVEKVITAEEKRFWEYLIKYSELYAFVLIGKEFNLIGDTTNAIGAAKFLTKDLGLIPGAIVLVDNPREDLKSGISETIEKHSAGLSPKVVFDNDTGHIWNLLADHKADIIFGSSSDRIQAAKIGSRLIPYSYPLYDQIVLSRGYAGYRGAINLAEELGKRLLAG